MSSVNICQGKDTEKDFYGFESNSVFDLSYKCPQNLILQKLLNKRLHANVMFNIGFH